MHTYTPANSVFDGPVTNLLLVLCVLVEILSRAHTKREKNHDDFQFGTVTDRFPSDGGHKPGSGRVKYSWLRNMLRVFAALTIDGSRFMITIYTGRGSLRPPAHSKLQSRNHSSLPLRDSQAEEAEKVQNLVRKSKTARSRGIGIRFAFDRRCARC